MQNEILNIFSQYNATALETAKRLGELNMNTFERIASKQAEIVGQCMESATKQAELLGSTKDYKEYLAAQTEMSRSCGEKLMTNVRETTDILNEVRNELTAMVEENTKLAAENIEKVSDLAKEAA